jgi:hypothetical protein
VQIASHMQVYHEFNQRQTNHQVQAFLLPEFHQVDKVAHAWSTIQNGIYFQQLELQFFY